LSEILPSNGLGPGYVRLAKVAYKSSTYDVTHKKPQPPSKNFFFECKLQDLPSLLSGSVVLTRPEKFPRKVTCDPAVFSRTA